MASFSQDSVKHRAAEINPYLLLKCLNSAAALPTKMSSKMSEYLKTVEYCVISPDSNEELLLFASD